MKKILLFPTILLSLSLLTSCNAGSDSETNIAENNFDSSYQGVIAGKVLTTEPITKMVVGILNSDNQPHCTGVLVTRNIVLTAAHCAFMQDELSVFFGTDYKKSRRVHVIDRAIMDDFMSIQFDIENFVLEKAAWDIALLKIEENAPIEYKPLKLLNKFSLINKNTEYINIGYGHSVYEDIALSDIEVKKIMSLRAQVDGGYKSLGKLSPDEKKLYNTNIQCSTKEDGSLTDCKNAIRKGSGTLRQGKAQLKRFENETEIMTLASKTQGVCNGDSGGPLLLEKDNQFIVVGILSRGADGDGCTEGDIYTQLTNGKVRHWISEKIKSFSL